MYSTTPLNSSMLAKTMHDYYQEKAQERLATAVTDNPTPKKKWRFQFMNLLGRRPFAEQENKEMSMNPAG